MFFTVKGIGDEVWILCNVPTAQVSQVGHRLIDATSQAASRGHLPRSMVGEPQAVGVASRVYHLLGTILPPSTRI